MYKIFLPCFSSMRVIIVITYDRTIITVHVTMHPYRLTEVQLDDSSDTSNLDAPLCNYLFNNNAGSISIPVNFYSRAYRFIYTELIRVQLLFKSETDKWPRSSKNERKERNWQKMKFITQVRNISIFPYDLLKFTSRYFCILH